MLSLRPVFGASRAVLADRRCGRPGDMHCVNWPAWCQAHYCAEMRARDPIRSWLDREAADNGVARLWELLPAPAARSSRACRSWRTAAQASC